MAKKVLETITNVVDVILGSFVSVVGLTIFSFIAPIKAKKRTCGVYHNIKNPDGTKVNFIDFIKRFSINQEAITLWSDEGKIAIVHGGFGDFIIKGQKANHFSMSRQFDSGVYYLVSCCNGSHYNFEFENKIFIKDHYSAASYSTTLILPVGGNLYTWASPVIDVYVTLASIRTWKYLPKLIASMRSESK